MVEIDQAWERFRVASDPEPESIEMLEASYYAGALSMILFLKAGGNVNVALAAIEAYGIDCPTFVTH